MTALAADRITSHMNEGSDPRNTGEDDILFFPVAASVQIFKGAIVVISAGYAQPATTALNLVAAGCALGDADNRTGLAGAQMIAVRSGVFAWNNSSAGPDLIAQANVGAIAYLADDQTLALTSATGTRSPAGPIVRVDSVNGVWVNINSVLSRGNTAALAGGNTGVPSATSAPAFTGAAPAFTGTAPTAVINTTALVTGTGMTASGQTMTSTDNKTATLNQYAGALLFCAAHGPYIIASNTAVTGAPLVLTIATSIPTTDAGVYGIYAGATPVGTVAVVTGTIAAVPTATHTHPEN